MIDIDDMRKEFASFIGKQNPPGSLDDALAHVLSLTYTTARNDLLQELKASPEDLEKFTVKGLYTLAERAAYLLMTDRNQGVMRTKLGIDGELSARTFLELLHEMQISIGTTYQQKRLKNLELALLGKSREKEYKQ